MTPADGLGARPAASRSCTNNAKLIFSKQALVAPIVKVALHGGERRKVLWQHPPLTTRRAMYKIASSTLRNSVSRGRPNV
jgi:hypothetical protein